MTKLAAQADGGYIFQFAYYPSSGQVQPRVDFSRLGERRDVTGVRVEIANRATGAVVAGRVFPPPANHVFQEMWTVGELGEGDYECRVRLDGVRVPEKKIEFIRRIFPWEGNQLGKSDILVPPFTPITVEYARRAEDGGQRTEDGGRRSEVGGRESEVGSRAPVPLTPTTGHRDATLSPEASAVEQPDAASRPPTSDLRLPTSDLPTVGVILRKHHLDGLGLWQQVNSLDRDLFTQPMRLEIRRNGRTEPVVARDFRIVEHRDTRLVTESIFDGGRTLGEWDYDGVLKWTLDLDQDPRPIEALTLVITLAEPLMPLLHTCSDGIRIHYAGAVPRGSGRVWDSSMARRRVMLADYVPYIWLGAEERGLAVFGENDRGWVQGRGNPSQELRRVGGTLELRLNLIAAPMTLTEPRQIILGFQATPTKPMPADWRRWSKGWENPDRTAPHFTFLGSGWSWGARATAMDVYPWDEDFSLWDRFAEARRTGRSDPQYLTDWLQRTAEGQERERMRREVGYGFRMMQDRPQNVLVYTNPRGVRFDTPEGRTFLNEWHRMALPPRRTWPVGEGVTYDVNIAESFRDYSVWHYSRMLETFVDSIYWDDTFLQSTYVPGTGAYIRPDGRSQPAAGLWDLRELIRRTAVLQVEMGRTPRNMLHMTNTAIAPVMSFGQMLYTWENPRSNLDFQNRYSREYLRAESMGRQHGMVPFAMLPTAGGEAGTQAKRSGIGVTLVHEIRLYGSERGARSAHRKLIDFGYGQPEVRVFNYWQEDNPVSVTGTDAATLCVSKPGAVLVVVCDYGEGGTVELALDEATLNLRPPLTARDVETGKKLPPPAGTRLRFEVGKHDYRIIEFAENQTL